MMVDMNGPHGRHLKPPVLWLDRREVAHKREISMNPSGNRALLAAIAGLLATAATGATAHAADTWIDCTGQMVTTKAGKADAPVQVHEIYQIDDVAKGLFKYS